jgi:hypothetical protein
MPDIPVGAQIFDLVFHPTHSTVYTGLLTGEIKSFTYDEQGQYESGFTQRPSKRSCRGLTLSEDGVHLWAVGKSKSLLYVSPPSLGFIRLLLAPARLMQRLADWSRREQAHTSKLQKNSGAEASPRHN